MQTFDALTIAINGYILLSIKDTSIGGYGITGGNICGWYTVIDDASNINILKL